MDTTTSFSIGDWYLYACLFAAIGAAFWAHRASNQQGIKRADSLRHGATTVELLGIVLSIVWAAKVFPYAPIAVVFVAGWIAATMMRAATLDHVVKSFKQGGIISGLMAGMLWILLFSVLYGSGFFYALNDSSDAAQQRLEASQPAQALDAEINLTRAQLRDMAAFADASKAHANQQALNATLQSSQAEHARLTSELAAAESQLASCPRNYFTKCINPAKQKIAALQSQLSGLTMPDTSNSYSARHDEYKGLQQHLISLQKQRAALSESGSGTVEQWKAEDRAIGDLLGISYEHANRVKWLIATGLFDLIGLLARIIAALIAVTLAEIGTQAFRRALDAALSTTNDSDAAYRFAEQARQNAIETARIDNAAKDSDTGASLRGGKPAMGMSFAPERQRDFAPSVLDAIHSSNARFKDDYDAMLNDAKPAHNTRDVHAHSTPDTPAHSMRDLSAHIPAHSDAHDIPAHTPAHSDAPDTAAQNDTPDIAAHNAPRIDPHIVYKDYERVPAHLSQKAGKGRVGKIDTCSDCGIDYIVPAYNAKRCTSCAEKARGSYRRTKTKSKT